MTAAKAMEYQISQQLMRRREGERGSKFSPRFPDRLITALAVAVVLAALGTYMPEVFWVLAGTGSILALGDK